MSVTTHARHLACLALGIWTFAGGTAWADSIETALMPGQVIEGHAKWEETCTTCHKRFDKAAQTGLCLDCHKDVRKDVDRRQGFHGRFKEQRECKECHTEHKGRAENIAPINEQTFDHAQTDFALHGAHADAKKVECKSCHKPKTKFRDAPSGCYSCHKKDDTHKGKLGTACADCHTDRNWKEIRFDHDKTRYKLRNKHVEVPCKDCHANDRFKDTPMDCYSCHKKDDKGRLTRISYERLSPEGWQQAIKRMVRLNGLSLTPEDARAIVKYLGTYHGLAPEEAKPAMYYAEHRLQEETVPDESVRTACTVCHTYGRIISQRRNKEEWDLLVNMHVGYFPVVEFQGFRRFPPPPDAALISTG